MARGESNATLDPAEWSQRLKRRVDELDRMVVESGECITCGDLRTMRALADQIAYALDMLVLGTARAEAGPEAEDARA